MVFEKMNGGRRRGRNRGRMRRRNGLRGRGVKGRMGRMKVEKEWWEWRIVGSGIFWWGFVGGEGRSIGGEIFRAGLMWARIL